MNTEQKRVAGLRPLPYDHRDFSHDAVFGSAPLTELPQEFFTSDPLVIKDQAYLDFCAAFAGTEISEDQEGTELDPLSLFAWAKEIVAKQEGDPTAWKEWGLNLRDLCKTLCDVGSLAMEFAPYKLDPTDATRDRDFYANPANYSQELKMLAAEHRKSTYLAVTGPYDLFDNIRSTIWKNRAAHQSVLTGTAWRSEWSNAVGGVIPTTYSQDSIGGHAIKVFGWMVVEDGETYLVVQNSWGPSVGDGGLYYFPREVVNREFIFGSFVFNDMPRDVIEYHSENGLAVTDNPFRKLLVVLWNFIKSFFPKK